MSTLDILKKYAPGNTDPKAALDIAAVFEQAAAAIRGQAEQQKKHDTFMQEHKAKIQGRGARLAAFGEAIQKNKYEKVDMEITALGWVNGFRSYKTGVRTFGLKGVQGFQLKVEGDKFSILEKGVEVVPKTHVAHVSSVVNQFKKDRKL